VIGDTYTVPLASDQDVKNRTWGVKVFCSGCNSSKERRTPPVLAGKPEIRRQTLPAEGPAKPICYFTKSPWPVPSRARVYASSSERENSSAHGSSPRLGWPWAFHSHHAFFFFCLKLQSEISVPLLQMGLVVPKPTNVVRVENRSYRAIRANSGKSPTDMVAKMNRAPKTQLSAAYLFLVSRN